MFYVEKRQCSAVSTLKSLLSFKDIDFNTYVLLILRVFEMYISTPGGNIRCLYDNKTH